MNPLVADVPAGGECQQRVAGRRMILQTRDLIQSDTLPLTQELLLQMLGVQRSSVTIVARKLQEAGVIDYRRGRIRILDVEGLQDSCCECYGAINGHFRRLVGWSPKVVTGPAQGHRCDFAIYRVAFKTGKAA